MLPCGRSSRFYILSLRYPRGVPMRVAVPIITEGRWTHAGRIGTVARRWLAVIGRAASPSETARVNIIPQVRDEVKCPPAQVFLDQEFAFLYIRTMFPYSE